MFDAHYQFAIGGMCCGIFQTFGTPEKCLALAVLEKPRIKVGKDEWVCSLYSQ